MRWLGKSQNGKMNQETKDEKTRQEGNISFLEPSSFIMETWINHDDFIA